VGKAFVDFQIEFSSLETRLLLPEDSPRSDYAIVDCRDENMIGTDKQDNSTPGNLLAIQCAGKLLCEQQCLCRTVAILRISYVNPLCPIGDLLTRRENVVHNVDGRNV
jgi:hypothetical protein